MDNCLLLYIAVVLYAVIGQLHANKRDNHANHEESYSPFLFPKIQEIFFMLAFSASR